ncbi:caspase, EACC1-associated type [Nocardia asiatica]|uniref:caspase, EACC1-associated type n=1 Tax=Nocardia asiatica TaxID=209252 RepID=UPI003CC7C47F
MTDPRGLVAEGARVLLVGTGRHSGTELSSMPAIPRTVNALAAALVDRCGVNPDAVRVLHDPADPAEFGSAVTEAARQATSVLFVYFTGHGLIGPDRELYLATASTISLVDELTYRALSYATVRDQVSRSKAPTTVVVLDCCFAGRASGAPSATAADPFIATAVRGTYVMSAAARSEAAMAKPGDTYTGFTGELLRLLETGDPTRRRWLSLADIYECLDRRLPQRGYPRPRQFASDSSAQFILASNAGFPTGAGKGGDQPPPVVGEDGTSCPYRGLEPYESGDARFFFGRSDAINEVVESIGRKVGEGGPLVVLGPSGSGKSSLLRAGVVPRLGKGVLPGSSGWRVRLFTPDERPLAQLAAALGLDGSTDLPSVADLVAAARTSRGHDSRTMLIVDQFEELFTTSEEGERRDFIGALCSAAAREGAGGNAVVVLVLRADFYSHCLEYPELVTALRTSTSLVVPMTDAELTEAIEKPAEVEGLVVQPELVGVVLRELRANDTELNPAGALPLLSYALMLTWSRRSGKTLTVAGYDAEGGLRTAISRRAEEIFEALDPEAREVARRVLPLMVNVGTSADHTRAKVPLNRFQADGPARAVLDAFARARLVTIDADNATLAHEALLRAWPRLGKWIDSDRMDLVRGQQIRDASLRWELLDFDPGALYRGRALTEAQLWRDADTRGREMTELERRFLDASSADEDEQARRERAQRERERLQNRRLRRSNRWLRVAATVLVIVSVVAAGAGGIAVDRTRESQAYATELQEQLRVAATRLLISQADSVRATDPRRALQLGIAAYRIESDAVTRASLADAIMTTSLMGAMLGRPIGFSGDGTRVLTVWDGTTGGAGNRVMSWPLDGREPGHADGDWELVGTGQLTEMALSTDGRVLVTADTHGRLRIWDLTDPRHGKPIGPVFGGDEQTEAVALSSDGSRLVTGTGKGTLSYWDLSDPTSPRRLGDPVPVDAPVQHLALRSDDRLLLVGVGNDPPRVFQVPTVGPLQMSTTIPLSLQRPYNDVLDPNQVTGIDISADGRLAAICATGGCQPWDISDPARPAPLGGPLVKASAAAFSPDNSILAVHAGNGAVELWDVTGTVPKRTGTTPAGSEVGDLLFAPDGQRLVVRETWQRSTLWTMRPLQWAVARQAESAVGATGKALASAGPWVATNGPANQVLLWTTTGEPLATLHTGAEGGVTALAADERGTLLGIGGGRPPDRAVIEVWNVADPRHPSRLATPRGGTLRTITGLTFTTDGARLLVSDPEYVVEWDISTAELAVTMGNPWPYYHRPIAVSLPARAMARIKATDLVGESPIGGQIELWPADGVGPIAGSGAYELPGPGSEGSVVAFDPAGRTLAVGGIDGTLTLWEPLRDDEYRRYAHRRSLPVPAHVSPVSAIGFDPAGRIAMTAGFDGTLSAWFVSDNGPLRLGGSIQAHDGEITRLAFSADSRTLYTIGADSTLQRWDLSRLVGLLDNPASLACQLAGGGMDREAWNTFVVNQPYRDTCD